MSAYVHPVVRDNVRGKGRGANFIAGLLIVDGGLSRSFFTKPRTKRRRRDMHDAINEVLKRKPSLYELLVPEARRRGWL